MIKLSKLNGVEILINSDQIAYIEKIPESKIVMMNGEYMLIKEDIDTIIDKVAEYKKKCAAVDRETIRECLLNTGDAEQ